MGPVATPELNSIIRGVARFSAAFSVLILTSPQFAVVAAPADDGTIRDLTIKLNDPTVPIKEKSELYRRRANAYLTTIGPDRIRRDQHLLADDNRHKAVADLVAAVGSDPSNAEAYVELGDQTTIESIERGDIYDEARQSLDIQKSIDDYTAALRIGLPSRKDTAEVYYKRAMREISDDARLADFNSAVKYDGRNGDFLFARGMFFHSLGSTTGSDEMRNKALADFSAALKLPRHLNGACDIYSRRAEIYDAMKNHDLAAEDYSAAIKMAISPETSMSCWNEYYGPAYSIGSAYRSRAGEYDRLGKFDLAIADYSVLIDEKLGLPTYDSMDSVYFDRAKDYDQIGQPDKAAADRLAGGDRGPDQSGPLGGGQ